MYETSEDELRKTMERTNDLIVDVLKKTCCSASQCKTKNLENVDTGWLELVISFCVSDYLSLCHWSFTIGFFHLKYLFIPNAEGLTFFEDLMEESSFSSSLMVLERDYEMNNKCDLDERVFVNDEDSLLGTGSLSGGAISVTGVKVY